MPITIQTSTMTHENGYDTGYAVRLVDDETGALITEVNLFPYENAAMADVAVYERVYGEFRLAYASPHTREHEQAYFNRAERS